MIDRNGEFIFSEVNQAGQFLWLESFGIPALDAFAEFIASGDSEFKWSDRDNPVSIDMASNSSVYKKLLDEESFQSRPPWLDGKVRRDAMASSIGGHYG
ncbi:hypothetical protein [Sphingomonas oryzagri]